MTLRGKFTVALAAFVASAQLAFADDVLRRFDFGLRAGDAKATLVRAGSVYSSQVGFGFEAGAELTETNRGVQSEKPFFFSVDLPEGNYRVTAKLVGVRGDSDLTIKAESRRVLVPSVPIRDGEMRDVTFIVNIRTPEIPGGGRVRLKPREIGALHWDKRLTLEFNGRRPAIGALTFAPVDVPTLFLAGDSTVTDQQIEPWAAWGQMLPAFFEPTIAVANHAESGETIKSFVGERRFDRVLSLIKPGDYFFLQFAHNDQKQGPEHSDAASGYRDYVRRFVKEIRAKGATPVLVTSMERRNFDDAGQHIVPSLDGYPAALRELGRELNVPVIDLNAMSVKFYEALGPEAAKQAFVHFAANSYPGQDKALADDTHFSSYGAYELAKCVVEGIKQNVPALAAYLRTNLANYDPANPGKFSEWRLPPSPPKPVVKPEGS